jgi:site-specific recombinase XerD
MNIQQVLARTRELIRLKHMAYSTEKTYCHWITAYCHHLRECPSDLPPEKKLEAFLSGEARRGCSAGTQNQAFAALLFLYRDVLGKDLGKVDALRAKRPQFARHAPSREDTFAILTNVRDHGSYPTRLIVHLLYGCGLRISEALNLRVKDVDLDNSRLIIREPKHGHDRYVAIPCSLADAIRMQLERAAQAHAQHVRDAIPVPLPGLLAKKYPRAAFDIGWAWLFPASGVCKHPRTGETVVYRCLESNVQRAVRAAAQRAGISSIITPHHLRHAYATHAMAGGAFVRDIQAALGHRSLETTMGYISPEAARIVSPLDEAFSRNRLVQKP